MFNFSLSYNQGSHPLYNGNISQTQWRTASTDNALKSYGYTYDALNRIVGATGAGDMSKFNLSGITYDKNGNLLSLSRLGHKSISPILNDTDDSDYGTMDVLDYTYHNGQMSNRLHKVRDDGEAAYGFKDSSGDTQDYWYDSNGNMTSDANKGITSISYNHLNLPVSMDIDGGTIDYVYDAAGTKLKKTVSTGAVTEYAGDHVYSGNSTSTTLQFFGHPEGYVNVENNGYRYVYQYTDHLGNVRVSYTDDPSNPGQPTILEENNYYPFGLKHKGYNNGGDTALGNDAAQKWKYQGVELEEALGLDLYEFELRQYNPAIGRFMTPDPYEQFDNPYLAMGNNPILAFDPDGGKCYDVSGNEIACPSDDIYDDYRDSDKNNITIFDEVTVVGEDKSDVDEGQFVKRIRGDQTLVIVPNDADVEETDLSEVDMGSSLPNKDRIETKAAATIMIKALELSDPTPDVPEVARIISEIRTLNRLRRMKLPRSSTRTTSEAPSTNSSTSSALPAGHTRTGRTVMVSGQSRDIIRGPQGGLYYINSNGNRVSLNRDGTKRD